MKKFLTLSILLLGFISYGQKFEQTVADASCECIQELPDLTDENYKNCISTSLTEALVKGDVKRNMKQIGTVKGMKSTLEKVYGILAESCSFNSNKELKQKRELYYSASPNYEANISYNMGKDFMEQGNYQLAISSFEKALENDENFVLALDDIAISYRQLNQFEEAITYYKKSLAVFPEGDFALMNIAVVYNLKEDYKTSNEYYAQLMQYQPHNAEGYYGFGRNLSFLEDYENALLHIIKAHKIYIFEKSDYEKHSLQMIGILYGLMKEKGKEKAFYRIAKENGITIKQ